MTTSSWEQQENQGMGAFYALILLLVVSMLMVGALAITGTGANDHAVQSHGEKVVAMALTCLPNPQLTFWNPTSKRWGMACEIDGRWYIAIMNESGERLVTAFRNKAKTAEKLIAYMKNAGYQIP